MCPEEGFASREQGCVIEHFDRGFGAGCGAFAELPTGEVDRAVFVISNFDEVFVDTAASDLDAMNEYLPFFRIGGFRSKKKGADHEHEECAENIRGDNEGVWSDGHKRGVAIGAATNRGRSVRSREEFAWDRIILAYRSTRF